MAFSLAGLAPLTSGYYQGKDELMRRQMLAYQQQKQQQQDQGLAALANAYANQQQMPPPATPMPPPPGQQSQPQQPPQGQPPQGGPPQGMPPGAMPRGQMGPPPQQQGPMPPQQRPQPQQAPQAPQVKPYTAPQPPQMASPQQQAPQSQIPPPPQVTAAVQSTLPDLETMASTLKKQGITGMALFAALQQHQQFLSTDGKQQLAQLSEQVRHMNAEAAMQRGGAAQTTAATGQDREKRLEAGADGQTAMSAAKISELKAQAVAAYARADKAANSGKYAEPEDVDLLARGVAAGKIDPKSLSTRGGLREHILERAMKINPDYDQKDFNSENALDVSAARTAGTSGANAAIASDAAQGGADILMKASEKVPRTAITSMNKMWNASRSEFQSSEYGAFAAALNTFVNEYARAVNPKGAATVSDKEHAREILSAADSQENLEAKMGILRQEMDRAKKAPRDVADDLRKDRKAAGGGKPKPTPADLAYAKAHPELKAQFKDHFGIDP